MRAELRALGPTPESRAGPATYSRDDTSPLPSELGGQIWDLPDGRIILASVILWGGGVRVESEGRKSRDRAGSFKIHARCLSAHCRAWTLPRALGAPSRPATASRRNLRHPCPSVPAHGPHLCTRDRVPSCAELGEERALPSEEKRRGMGCVGELEGKGAERAG